MADPVLVTVTKGQWTKIATNVTTGNVWRKESTGTYFQTIRDTGNAAPTTLEPEGVKAFIKNPDNFEIISTVSIDVYLWVRGQIDGKVRVDL